VGLETSVTWFEQRMMKVQQGRRGLNKERRKRYCRGMFSCQRVFWVSHYGTRGKRLKCQFPRLLLVKVGRWRARFCLLKVCH
jgi:hypothetical protein